MLKSMLHYLFSRASLIGTNLKFQRNFQLGSKA